MKRVYWYSFWSIAMFHLMATGGAMLKAFSMGMRRFDTGEASTVGEQVLMVAWKSLSFPVVTLCSKTKAMQCPGVFGWLPFILNSLLWAAVFIGLIMAVGKFTNPQNHGARGRLASSPP